MQFKCRDKLGAIGRQGGPENDSLRQVKRRHPQSWRTEWSDDGIEGRCQSEIQTVGSDTSPDESQDDEQSLQMDPDRSQRERGSGRKQLQNLEPVLQREKRL